MTFGEKIKAARKSADMTQAELAGDFVTRNMLSKIEHDTVMPSLQTLMYLARRLHVSPARLLSDEPEHTGEFDFHSSEIRSFFLEGCLDECLVACERIEGEGSDEIDLIRSICYLGRGERRFGEGRLKAARSDFEASLRASSKTAYASADIIRQNNLMLRELALIESGELPSVGEAAASDDIAPLRARHEQLYAERIIEKLLSERKIVAAGQLVDTVLPQDSVIARKMRARVSEESGDLGGAIEQMRDLAEQDGLSGAERFMIWGHLQRLYAEALDYNASYSCARIRAEILAELYPEQDRDDLIC